MAAARQPAELPVFTLYGSAGIARVHTEQFLSLLGPDPELRDCGIVWTEHGKAEMLRPVKFDKDGHGLAVVFTYHGPVDPRLFPGPPSGKSRPFYDIAYDYVHNLIVKHPEVVDAIAVGLDLLTVVETGGVLIGAVIAATGSAVTGVGAVAEPLEWDAAATATAALGSSLLLLYADGTDWALQRGGKEAEIEKFEQSKFYQKTEAVAPIIAIFDPLREGLEVLTASRDLGTLRPEIEASHIMLKEAQSGVSAARDNVNAAALREKNILQYESVPGKITTAASGVAMKNAEEARLTAERGYNAAEKAASSARKNLREMQKKAIRLNKIIKKYTSIKKFGRSTMREAFIENGYSSAVYALNNPWSSNFGKPVSLAQVRNPFSHAHCIYRDPWDALIPYHLKSNLFAAKLNFKHHLTIRVSAIQSPQQRH